MRQHIHTLVCVTGSRSVFLWAAHIQNSPGIWEQAAQIPPASSVYRLAYLGPALTPSTNSLTPTTEAAAKDSEQTGAQVF